MNNARLYQVLKGPIFSEKSQRLSDALDVQVLKVDGTATKREIKAAVELMYEGVKVAKVNTLNVKGKSKRFGRNIGRRNDWKKAYITFEEVEQQSGNDAGEAAASASESANNE